MKLAEIITRIDGHVFNDTVPLDVEIQSGFGADLMSDVLTSARANALLLTGLCNPQVVRTAQIADIRAIVFVRGKQPLPETIELATEENIPLIGSPHGMFEICGRLYQAGLPSFESGMKADENA